MQKLFLSCLCAVLAAPAWGVESIPIVDQALAVVQQSCVECHCPDKHRGGLDMTSRETLLKGGDSGTVFDAGKLAKSSALFRTTAHLEEPFMPHKRDKLPQASIDILEKWIDAGVPYNRVLVPPKRARAEALWSFSALKKPAVPTFNDESWAVTPIDRFVMAAQSRAGLTPTVQASKQKLIRRLYFDLVGLPPTPAEIETFANSTDPKAYENLVDRLLASAHYGERWGRHWLDLARYADSMGYRFDDNTPGAYQYRDFVIRAFNADMPYDKFIRWQLAGDELAPGNPDALAATGFCAVGPRERDEGDPLNRRVIRNNELDDLVSTTCSSLLGLTMGCARCHDHKFDPLSQKEYYQLMTAFIPGHRKEMPFEQPAETDRRKYWEKESDLLEGKMADWFSRNAHKIDPIVEQWKKAVENLESEFRTKSNTDASPGDLSAIDFRLYKNDGLDAMPDFTSLKPTRVSLIRPGRIDLSQVPKATSVGAVFTGKLTVPSTGSYKFHLTSDDRARVFINGKLIVETDGLNGQETKTEAAILSPGKADIRVEYLQGPYGTELKLTWNGPVVARRSLSDGKFSAAFVQEFAKRGEKILGAEKHKMYQNLTADLGRFHDDPLACNELKSALSEAAIAEGQAIQKDRLALLATAPPPAKKCLAYVDKNGTPEKSFLLERGSVESPSEEVHLGFIAGLTSPNYQPSPKPAAARGTYYRAGMANWITDVDKGAGRLLARVLVNRLWYYHFGEGLIRTPNDFGSQGDVAVMPELLDWMASELIEGNWKIKSLQKMIVMSSVYRQDTTSEPAKTAIDPENRFWWHRRPTRIEAEILRDSILSVSGRLNKEMFGPAVMVPVPAETIITRTDGKSNYPKSIKEGPEVWRRSVYIFLKRTVQVPITAIFDGPDYSCSLGRRDRTTVATQALLLMNDTLVRSCSAELAGKIEAQAGTNNAVCIENAFRQTLGRAPSSSELEKALQFLNRQTELRNGDRKAALVDFCQALLSLNEFIYVD